MKSIVDKQIMKIVKDIIRPFDIQSPLDLKRVVENPIIENVLVPLVEKETTQDLFPKEKNRKFFRLYEQPGFQIWMVRYGEESDSSGTREFMETDADYTITTTMVFYTGVVKATAPIGFVDEKMQSSITDTSILMISSEYRKYMVDLDSQIEFISFILKSIYNKCLGEPSTDCVVLHRKCISWREYYKIISAFMISKIISSYWGDSNMYEESNFLESMFEDSHEFGEFMDHLNSVYDRL